MYGPSNISTPAAKTKGPNDKYMSQNNKLIKPSQIKCNSFLNASLNGVTV